MRSGDLQRDPTCPALRTRPCATLSRGRDDALEDLKRSKRRLKSFLLRSKTFATRTGRTLECGPSALVCPRWCGATAAPTELSFFQSTCAPSASSRSDCQRLERELHDAVKGWRLYPVVEAIPGAARRGAHRRRYLDDRARRSQLRFDTPRKLMSYLGLTPSSTRRGRGAAKGASPRPATATRRARAGGRRVGVSVSSERSAGTCSSDSRSCRPRSRRSAGRRRCLVARRYRPADRPRPARLNQVVVAIAREMAAFAWAIRPHRAAGLLTADGPRPTER